MRPAHRGRTSFYRKGPAGVEQLDHAVKSAGMVALGNCGRLRMGVHDLIPYSFLANLIGRYRDDYPSVDLEIAEGTGGRQSRNCVRVSSTSRSRSGRHPLGSFRSRLHQRQRLHRLFQKDDRV